MARIYDISMPLRDSTPVWPGDAPYRLSMTLSLAAGDSVNLGSISMSVHAGTHADAPLHFAEGGPAAADLDVTAFLGPAIVVDVQGRTRIGIQDVVVEGLRSAPRLLLKTGAWSDLDLFPMEFPVIEEGVPAYLSGLGVVLLGVDVPSVDAFDSKELPNHHALHANGIQILESLNLAGVQAGRYDIVALPLRLVGADAAPVRAVLRTLE
jgi:arylformamidase